MKYRFKYKHASTAPVRELEMDNDQVAYAFRLAAMHLGKLQELSKSDFTKKEKKLLEDCLLLGYNMELAE